MRGVPGQEDTSRVEPVGQGRARAEVRGQVGAVAGREDVPVVAVQAGDPDLRDQRRVGVDGFPGHVDAEGAPHRRPAAVRYHRI